MSEHDVVVAGAGHNALVCAAYLARAGLRVLVLERAAAIGGDTATEEVTLPGFRHDLCASAHTIFQSSAIAALEATTKGAEAVRWRYASALDIVRERFADEYVRTFFLWLSLMTMSHVDQPGTGLLALSIAGGRQAFSWTTAEGGSGALPEALARIVRQHGGEVRTGAEVTRVLVEDGRAAGVATADGSEHRARRAVVSSIHVKHLPDVVGREALGETFVRGLARWRAGLTMFVTHYALDAEPRYRIEQGPTASVGAGICESTEDLLAALAAFRRGEVRLERPPLLAVTSSAIDPSRAPAGKHTLKGVGVLPYELRARGPARWDARQGGGSR